MVLDEGQHLRHVHAEHHAAPHRRGGVVQVHDGAGRAAQRLHRALDEVAARLRHDHEGHVLGHQVFVDEAAHEVEVGLRGGGKAHLDFLEADVHQRLEQLHLARAVHGLEQRLVAVAQVGGEPHGRAGEGVGGPAAVREGDGGGGLVFAAGLVDHDGLHESGGRWRGLVAPARYWKNRRRHPLQPSTGVEAGSWAGVRGVSGGVR